ncbi:hypothetical protein EJMLMN_EJMLMN_15005, partial [Dysosmobacter welbionis]
HCGRYRPHRHHCHLQAGPGDVRGYGVQLRYPSHPDAGGGVPERWPVHPHCGRPPRTGAGGQHVLRGRHPGVCYLAEQEQGCASQ